jgi:hypothetical protein
MNFHTALPVEHLQGVQAIEAVVREWTPEGIEGSISLVHALTWRGHLQLRFDGFRRNASTLAISAPFRSALLECGVTARPVLDLARDFLREIAPSPCDNPLNPRVL